MTILSQADYGLFTWKHRKILFSYGITVVIIRIATGYLNLKIGIALNDILTVLAIAAFLFLAELLLVYNYKKAVEKMNSEL